MNQNRSSIFSLKGHAVLATKLTEFKNKDMSYIEIYNNENKLTPELATYNINDQNFSLGTNYSAFLSGSIPPPNIEGNLLEDVLLPKVGIFLNETKEILFSSVFTSNSSTQSSNFKTQSELNSSASSQEGYVNILITNSQDQRAGHLADGTPVNEIFGAKVERIAAGESSTDSLTYVYVPASREYSVSMSSSKSGVVRFESYAPGEGEQALHGVLVDSMDFTENTVAKFNESEDPGNINIDQDGDGSVDKTVSLTSFSESGINEPPLTPRNFILQTNNSDPLLKWQKIMKNILQVTFSIQGRIPVRCLFKIH